MSAISVNLDFRDARTRAADTVLLGGNAGGPNPALAARMYGEALAGRAGCAGERLAVLAAAGIGRPQNWMEALDRLADAAELGRTAAQRQLAVLAGSDNPSPDTSWRTLRDSIDLRALLQPPVMRAVHESPTIALIDKLATPAMCRWLIERAQGLLQPGIVGDHKTGEWRSDPERTGTTAYFRVLDTDVVVVLTQERLARASGLIVAQQELPTVLSYEVGQEYKPHFDFILPSTQSFVDVLNTYGQRVATCLTWLNDDYQGGETEFPRINWRHRGKTGDAMLFINVTRPDIKPDKLSLHAGLPVTRGRKWLLSQWVREIPQPIV